MKILETPFDKIDYNSAPIQKQLEATYKTVAFTVSATLVLAAIIMIFKLIPLKECIFAIAGYSFILYLTCKHKDS